MKLRELIEEIPTPNGWETTGPMPEYQDPTILEERRPNGNSDVYRLSITKEGTSIVLQQQVDTFSDGEMREPIYDDGKDLPSIKQGQYFYYAPDGYISDEKVPQPDKDPLILFLDRRRARVYSQVHRVLLSQKEVDPSQFFGNELEGLTVYDCILDTVPTKEYPNHVGIIPGVVSPH